MAATMGGTMRAGSALCLMISASAMAQTPATVDTGGEDLDVITVTAGRERGSVQGDIKPEIQLGPQDIRAYGVGSIAELLTELTPQTTSGRGRGGEAPVVLVNGKRIANFAEIRNFPPEAIARVDILPEEVSLKYGFGANQRVVNFVLRERFRAVTGELEAGGPTDGGRASLEGDANFLRIRNGKRLSLESEYKYDSRLLESARGIVSSAPARPFDLAGNVTAPIVGAEIDPALSALAGQVVTVAAVPGSTPALGDFAARANAPNVTDVSRYRTLLPENKALSLAGSYATSIGGAAATISAGFDKTDTEARLGLPTASLVLPAGNPFSPFATDVLVNRYGNGPLISANDNVSARLGLAVNGSLGGWQWTATANYSHAEAKTLTDRGIDLGDAQARLAANDPGYNPFGLQALGGNILQDRAASNTDSGDAQLVLNGPLLPLPAGDLAASVKIGGQALGLSSESRRSGVFQATDLSRTQGNLQASFDLPIASRRNEVLAGIGNLSANFNIEVDRLSDFGTLTTLGYGFNWTPIDPLSFIVSVTDEDGAPTVQQLGNPQVTTPNVRVFDFITGNTVDIARIDGGNAGLIADNRRVVKLGVTLKPLKKDDLTISANFIDSRIRNPIASFPTATAELEAAFPDRFRRDAFGQLVSIDNRPVNFALSERQELRWGFTFSKAIKPTAAEAAAAAARRAAFEALRAAREKAGDVPPAPGSPGDRGPPAAGAGPANPGQRPGGFGGFGGQGRGGGGFGGRGGLDGRLQLSVFHTWTFKDTILIRDGVPLLDLLNGSATGSSGGQSRHRIEARAGIGKSGLGGRISVNWQSGTKVLTDPTGATTSPDDLFFGSLATVNLRLFADLGQRPGVARKVPFLRGARISLAVDNIANARINVRDRNGVTPIGYQPALLDPLGRTVTLSFRKLFF